MIILPSAVGEFNLMAYYFCTTKCFQFIRGRRKSRISLITTMQISLPRPSVIIEASWIISVISIRTYNRRSMAEEALSWMLFISSLFGTHLIIILINRVLQEAVSAIHAICDAVPVLPAMSGNGNVGWFASRFRRKKASKKRMYYRLKRIVSRRFL